MILFSLLFLIKEEISNAINSKIMIIWKANIDISKTKNILNSFLYSLLLLLSVTDIDFVGVTISFVCVIIDTVFVFVSVMVGKDCDAVLVGVIVGIIVFVLIAVFVGVNVGVKIDDLVIELVFVFIGVFVLVAFGVWLNDAVGDFNGIVWVIIGIVCDIV